MTAKEALSFSIGPIGGAILGILTLPLITWYFPPPEIGRLSMLQVAISFGLLFFSLGLDQAYVRDYYNTRDKLRLLKNCIFPSFTVLVVVCGFSLIYQKSLSLFLFGIESKPIFLLTIACISISLLNRYSALILRMTERGLIFSLGQIAPKITMLLLIVTYISSEAIPTATLIISTYTMSLAVSGLFYAWNTKKDWLPLLRIKIDLVEIRYLAPYAAPLLLSGLAYWGLISIDRIFLRIFSSYEQLGIYAVTAGLASAATILQSIFSTIWAPTVYKWVESGDANQKIQSTSQTILLLVLLIFSLSGVLSWIIGYLLPSAYYEAKFIFVAALAPPLLYTLSETTSIGIHITRRSGYILLASVIALMVNAIGNFILVPTYGASGAAASTCVAFWIFFLLRTEFSHMLGNPVARNKIYLFSLTSALLAATNSIFGKQNSNIYIILWGYLFLITLFHFRYEIINLYIGISAGNSSERKSKQQ